MPGRLVSVNVGRPRTVDTGKRSVTTGIFKAPVKGRVAVRGVNLEGDDQADRTVHGGPDKAVYAYATEDYAWWSGQLGRELAPATFGENLTTEGLDLTGASLGERWRVGSTLLEVRQPRFPCFKLALKMEDPRFVRTFGDAGRPGLYLGILEEGELGAGDAVEVVHRPGHGVTIGLMTQAFLHDRSQLARVLDAPELPLDWRAWITDHLAA